MLLEAFLDAALDSLKMLPFLLAAFLMIEILEHYSGNYLNRILSRVGRGGPIVGALLGCIPQCGFSVVAANLYAGGIITPGTLLAVFLSTSDEAILIFLENPGNGKEILWLLAIKIVIGAAAGYLIDLLIKKSDGKEPGEMCNDCGCHHGGHMGIAKAVLHHTLKMFLYVLVFTAVLNVIIELLGMERLSALLLGDSVFQPLMAGVIGMIPNCAASVMLAELFLNGAISFASVVAGLCAGAGIGLAVLFKVNKDQKENFKIAGLLYGIAAASGILLEVFI